VSVAYGREVDERARDLRAWFLDYGLARPNGSPSTFELTALGAEAAR
jgi:hypothetical protein